MTQDEILALHSMLGVRPDCTLEELRKAYRRQSRQWHPDRFVLPSEQKFATERMKLINHAYSELSAYHKHREEVSTDIESPALRQRSPTVRDDSVPPSPTEPATFSESLASDWRYTPPKTEHRPRLRIGLVALALAISIVYGYSVHEPNHSAGDHTGGDILHPERAPNSEDEAHVAPHRKVIYLSFGLEPNAVLALQGPPDYVDRDVWHYGDSRVFFSGGKVVGWDEQPNHPLRLSPASRQPPLRPSKGFQKGSTMDVVRAVQGEPSRVQETMWEYGPSRIYFKNGKVEGWYESPLMPLRIAR